MTALPQISGGSAAINFVGTLLESGRKPAKGGIEHRSHEGRKSAAPEFVVDEKLNVARPIINRIKCPAVLHAPERTIEVFNQNIQMSSVERDATGKRLADDLVGDFHVGDHDRI